MTNSTGAAELPEALRQIALDPENQPNQYGLKFLMHGPKMAFKIGNRQFTLDYEPDEPGEFEFMRDALISAFSIFTHDVKTAQVEALSAAQAGVPAGYALAPVEPTPAMIDAGCPAGEIVDHFDLAIAYRAMLAAAHQPSPSPAPAQPGQEGEPAGRFMDEADERKSAKEGYEKRIKRVSERNPNDEGMYTLGWWDRAWKAAARAPADSVTAPAVASEPIAYLYDDGSWTPAKTEEGRKLNDWMISAGSPKIGVHLASTAQPTPLTTLAQATQAGNQQEARPCHVFTVRKAGGLTEWEPTTMALALPDGAHALYTLPQPSPHDHADSVTAPMRQGKWTWVPVAPSTAMLVAGNHGQPGEFSALKVWEDMLGALDRSFDYTRPVDPPSTNPPAQAADSVLEDAARLERERICAAIKAEDDYCVDQGNYMLDSDDCIKIVRGEWVRPDFAVDAARKQGGA